jgi:hypothetical protein
MFTFSPEKRFREKCRVWNLCERITEVIVARSVAKKTIPMR